MMKKSRFSKKYMNLLKTLRKTRREAKLTQTEIAEHFERQASFISKVESGERRIDVVELAELCRLYKVTLAEFLKRAGIE
jgi:transcriptional regulator with XRE-family HTH domain